MKEKGGRIVGISAPSRASTLFNYVGLDEAIIDYVCEIEGSLKIGKCMPGTLIPVVEENRMFVDQPECAITGHPDFSPIQAEAVSERLDHLCEQIIQWFTAAQPIKQRVSHKIDRRQTLGGTASRTARREQSRKRSE